MLSILATNKNHLVQLIKNAILEHGFCCDLTHIDTSAIKNMDDLFSKKYGFEQFAGDITTWNVSNVTTMRGTFKNSLFNGILNHWDVSSVKNFTSTFEASIFQNSLSDWKPSSALSMERMFACSKFNQSINAWDVSSVDNFSSMFDKSEFNHSLDSWNLQSALDCTRMFAHSVFDQPLDNWDVGNVVLMPYMFSGSQFNHDISMWRLNSIGRIEKLEFQPSQIQFNADLWAKFYAIKTSGRPEIWRGLESMFFAAVFKHDISAWNLPPSVQIRDMFRANKEGAAQQTPMPWNIDIFVDADTFPINFDLAKISKDFQALNDNISLSRADTIKYMITQLLVEQNNYVLDVISLPSLEL